MVISKVINGLKILKSLTKIQLLGKRIPIYCEWEITHYCNMNCAWCSTLTPSRNTASDLSTKESIDIIDQLAELGTKGIHFSGGEPTLRKDLPDLITRVKEHQMMVGFTTNGSGTIASLEKLLHADLIRVSIDGTEKFHDNQREYRGAYKKAIQALEFFISKNKKPMLAAFYKDEENFPMLVDLAKTCQTLGIKMILAIYQAFHLKKEGVRGKDENASNARSMYLHAIDRLNNEFGDVVANAELVSSVVRAGGLDSYGCRAMDSAITIKADGSVCLPCPPINQTSKQGNLREIYYSPEAELIQRTQGKMPECSGCLAGCMIYASSLLNFKGQLSLFKSYGRNFFSSTI
jgi:MoaA/NifB/PqqE/SkfB family radical SAM enzyme